MNLDRLAPPRTTSDSLSGPRPFPHPEPVSARPAAICCRNGDSNCAGRSGRGVGSNFHCNNAGWAPGLLCWAAFESCRSGLCRPDRTLAARLKVVGSALLPFLMAKSGRRFSTIAGASLRL